MTQQAVIVYQSRTGTTRTFAQGIGAYLETRGFQSRVVSIADAGARELGDADVVLLGCWTGGLIVLAQHPDKPWRDFAGSLSAVKAQKVGLFTTYGVATGGMFKKMAACLAGKTVPVSLELKSRGGKVSDLHRQALDRFLGLP